MTPPSYLADISRNALYRASKSLKVLKIERETLTVPVLSHPSLRCIRGAQCNPLRTAMSRLSN